MPKLITVPESIDSSTKLQKLIDQTGNTSSIYSFSPDHLIEINSLVRLYNNTEFAGRGCKFRLMDNAPVSVFGVQIPCIAPKTKTGATGIHLHDLSFDGNYKNQKPAISTSKSDHGKGYHNFFGAGNISDPRITGLTNSSFYNIDTSYSQGDGFRIEGGSDLSFRNITSTYGGHDVIHLSTVYNSEVSGCKVNMRANNMVRVRNGHNIKIYGCEANGDTNLAWAPPIQIEGISANKYTEDVEIFDNVLYGSFGPGVWLAGNVPGNTGVSIHNNLILRCGRMPAGNGIPGVGGIVFDGMDNISIKNNTIVGCQGYGILAGTYQLASRYTGKATISRNIITGTRKSNTVGTGSGSGIANLAASRYALTCSENCMHDNISDLYKVTQSTGISKDPLFTADYHLKPESPCRLKDYNLGCYPDINKPDPVPTELLISCDTADVESIIKLLSNNYYIYHRRG